MAYPQRLRAEAIREVAFGTLTNTLAAVGAATTHIGRLVKFTNNTDQDIYVSLDGVTNHFRLPAISFLLIDVSTNQTTKDNFFIPEGQVFYMRYVTVAPTSGWASAEYVYGG